MVLTHSSEFLMCCLALAISAANELGDDPYTKKKRGIRNHCIRGLGHKGTVLELSGTVTRPKKNASNKSILEDLLLF